MDQWSLRVSGQPGYNQKVTEPYTLRERIDMANSMSRDKLERHLAWHSDSYTVETLNDIVRCIATMSKPMAEILDDLKIPREKTYMKFVELDGPPRPEELLPFQLRRITPGLIKAPVVGVQPMASPAALEALSSLMTITFKNIRGE